MVLIFDDQNCFLQTACNNLFDTIDFISNGAGYLFDGKSFSAFITGYLNF